MVITGRDGAWARRRRRRKEVGGRSGGWVRRRGKRKKTGVLMKELQRHLFRRSFGD